MSMIPLLVESSSLLVGLVTLLVLLLALGVVRGVGKGRPHS